MPSLQGALDHGRQRVFVQRHQDQRVHVSGKHGLHGGRLLQGPRLVMAHQDQLDAGLRSRPLHPVANLAIACIRLVVAQRHAQGVPPAHCRHSGRVRQDGLVIFGDQLHGEQDFGSHGQSLQRLQRGDYAAPSELVQVLPDRGAQFIGSQPGPTQVRGVVPYSREILVAQPLRRLDRSQRHFVVDRKHSLDTRARLQHAVEQTAQGLRQAFAELPDTC